MTKKRVTGYIGENDDTKVMTEWFENPRDGEMTGIKLGAQVRGWSDVEIEEKDDD